MNEPPNRVDATTERLTQEIEALGEALIDFQEAFSGVNDEHLVDAFLSPLELGKKLVAFHGERVTLTVADDIANLRSLFARHHIPREDAELGPLESLKRLRSARGALIADIDDVLLAATAVGLMPREPALQPPTSAVFERTEMANLLAGMERRLSNVEKALDNLRPEGADALNHSPQQIGLVNFFIDSLALEVAFAKLEVTMREFGDFASLTRAVEAIAELTRDFVVTVRAMRHRVTQSLGTAAETLRPLVQRVTSGMKALVYHARRISSPRVLPQSDSSSAQPTSQSQIQLGRRPNLAERAKAVLNFFAGPPPPISVPVGRRVYAIGDIHGRLDLLDELLANIEADDRMRGFAKTELIFLGDLIDRGPDSRGVVERLLELSRGETPVRILMGNHEEVLLRAAAGETRALRFLCRIGGRETLLSYGVSEEEYRTLDSGELTVLVSERIPQEHLEFLQTFEDRIEVGGYLFVHAGLRPGVAVEDQKASDLRWIREDFLEHRDSFFGKMVVHGHSITEEIDERSNRIGIDTGAFASGRLTAIGLERNDRWYIST